MSMKEKAGEITAPLRLTCKASAERRMKLNIILLQCPTDSHTFLCEAVSNDYVFVKKTIFVQMQPCKTRKNK